MKQGLIWLELAGLLFCAMPVCAQMDVLTARVLKDDVNLRARPIMTAEVVGQVATGDLLVVRVVEPEWVEVVPPTNVDVWVHSELVKDGAITSDRTKVRSGPGINYNSVGQLSKQDRVEVRGVKGEWVRIAPPPSSSLWVSRTLVEVKEPKQPEPAQPVEVAAVTEAPMAMPPPQAPLQAAPDLAAAVPEAVAQPPSPAPEPAKPVEKIPPPPADLNLIPVQGQGQVREFAGTLRLTAYLIRSPSDYRLVGYDEDGRSHTICYVRGNGAQLRDLLGREMKVTGHTYWVTGKEHPVVKIDRIILKKI